MLIGVTSIVPLLLSFYFSFTDYALLARKGLVAAKLPEASVSRVLVQSGATMKGQPARVWKREG